ncbi:MAG: hypothetical protein A2X94_08805 [Bdellovibrionales bacterium GWB1_55_8]|nr:MAG: hypothetical protein A2X94_08805 [Bdellovibrionales bacterium GWB1_55_8]
MRYLEPVFRPPSEAGSYILQVTYGCSHNRCTFCSMYREKTFRVRDENEVFEDIREAARVMSGCERVFLADGDALILRTDRLLRILDQLEQHFPRLARVAIYSDARGINLKSDEELLSLRERKLGMIYLGLESGSDEVLRRIQKGATASEMTEAVRRAEALGIPVSVIGLLGVGGRELTEEHARQTAQVLSRMSPSFFSALTLTLVPDTPLAKDAEAGRFRMLTPEESLEELARIIVDVQTERPVVFRTNHASNYVPLKGTLPENRERILEAIAWALKNRALKPEWMRGL